MEDSKNVPPPSKGSSSPADRIIELTPELEVISPTRGKIIDLTQVLFSPGTPAPASKPVVPAIPKPIVARTTSPFSAKVSRQKGIESDVDAAFAYIQSRAEALRGPRVKAKPSEEDLKVSVPSPIGDWDDTIVDEALMLKGAEAIPEETPPPEPIQQVEEKPAEPTVSPMEAELSQAILEVEAEIPSMEEAKADDSPEFTEAVSPIDLPPLDEVPATEAVADEPAPAPPAPATLEVLDEEPASLLEAAIEIDEEIIELTDIVSAEELAAAQEENEEEIIELTEIVSAEELAAAGHTSSDTTAPKAEQPEEEEIIELVDRVELPLPEETAAMATELVLNPPESLPEFEPEAPATADLEDKDTEEMTLEVFAEKQAPGEPASEKQKPETNQVIWEEEEIIELVDRVELPLPEVSAAMATELVRNPPEPQSESEPQVSAPAALEDKDSEEMKLEVFTEKQAPPEAIKPESDQVIRLDSVLSHARKNQERISEEITLGVEDALAKEPVPTGEKFPIGIAMEEVKEALGPQAAPTEAEIEAVIEKVIRTKYGQTIEQMIATVVEKVVTREMDNIKRNLMEDQGESDEL
ncbi:MAG: hypothetical protein HY911_07800 [Desulfobacterales bacterium]|nr:hypothetical protein [Desulfobacterales bacterium]